MRGLLDVNVLIALFDQDHIFNDKAHDWLDAHKKAGIATCPLTENGLIRILSNPSYSKQIQLSPAEVIDRLSRFVSSHNHEFFPDNLSLRTSGFFDPEAILRSKQITDIYLLGLAVQHQACLVTFDGKVPLAAVCGATIDHLVEI